jgi:predicted nuclease with TOPRIM domain
MAWGRKEEELPESLKGKTPAQVAQELADAAKLKTDYETLKTQSAALTTSSETQKTELQQMRERLASLEANPPKQKELGKEPTSVLVDEAAAFRENLTPLAVANVQNTARIERMAAESRFLNGDKFEAAIFRQYRNEYETLANTLSLEQAASPGTYENVFAIIKGRHTVEILDMQKKGTGVFFTESGGHQPPNDPTKKSDQLSEEERKYAKKFGISEADYVKSRNEVPVMGVV